MKLRVEALTERWEGTPPCVITMRANGRFSFPPASHGAVRLRNALFGQIQPNQDVVHPENGDAETGDTQRGPMG